MANTKPLASQVKYGSGNNTVDKTLKKSILSFPTLVEAQAAATTLPDGQVVDVESEQKRYRVIDGALEFVEDMVRRELSASAGATMVGWIRADGGAVGTTLSKWLNRQTPSLFDFMTDEQIADVRGGTLQVDVSGAIQTALDSGYVSLEVPPYAFRCSAGITVPAGMVFFSSGFLPGNPAAGCRLVFDSDVITCVTVGGVDANNRSAAFRGFSVVRAEGVIPEGSIGVLNENTYASTVEDVNSVGHAVPFKFKSDGGALGITCVVNRIYSGRASDCHLVVDSWPELRMNQSRLGMNGAGDLNCSAFIRIEGGSTTNPAGGPNTIVVTNTQFNQGENKVDSWIRFANKTAGSISDTTMFQFSDVYVESINAGISSDSTWPLIHRLQLSNFTFNSLPGVPFIDLDPATGIGNWTVANGIVNGSCTISPDAQIDFLSVANTQFLGAVSVHGIGSSVVSFGDNNYASGLSVSGNFAQGVFKGGAVSGGSLSNTASGNVLIDLSPYNMQRNWMPVVGFGGGATGLTYSVQQGTFQEIGGFVFCQVYITLNTKGSSVGPLQIVNLPVPARSSYVGGAGGGALNDYAGMVGINGQPTFSVNGSIVNFYMAAPNGVTPITNGNLTDNARIRGTFFYAK